MKIQVGTVNLELVQDQIIPNRSRKFLLPCLKEYANGELVQRLNNVYKVAVGLGDMVISKRYYKAPERHLFILIDTKIAPNHFQNFIEWVIEQDFYEDDYVYGNIQKSTHHMVIIKFPQKYYDSFDTFKEGKYSEMFDKETISKFFSKAQTEAPQVLIKDNNYKIMFMRKLNAKYGTTIKAEEWEGELELPLRVDFNEEIFE